MSDQRCSICFLWMLSVVVALGVPMDALAQSGGGTRGPGALQPGPVPEPTPAPIEFDGEPYLIEDLGLSLFLPVGCTIERAFIPGGKQAFTIEPEDRTWVLQVFIERVNALDMTPQSYLDNVVALHHQRRRDQTVVVPGQPLLRHEEIDRTDNLVVGELTGSRVYMRLPHRASTLVTGYAAFQLEQREFLAFQFDVLTDEFERARPVFETIVAASRFNRPDPEELAERAASLMAGERFLHGLTPADLESALPAEPVLLRLYEPSKTGSDADAKEIGYQRVHIRTGQLGETTGRPRHSWSASERRFGFIATIEGRFLDRDRVVDVNANLYLSRDRNEESWSLITTVTGPNLETGRTESVSNNQTIIRNGSRLTSRILVERDPPVVRDWVLPDRGFISGVETYLLPRLVANADLAVPFAFYHFHTVRGSITLRRDSFSKTPIGWNREELRSELEDPHVSTYTSNGELIRATLANGTIMEPIDPERLVRLWKNKDLPIR